MKQFKILKVVALKEKDGLKNVIQTVDWMYENNVEGEYVAIKGGSNLPSPNAENFIDSEKVTLDMLAKWVEASFNSESLEALNTVLDNKLNEVVLDIKS